MNFNTFTIYLIEKNDNKIIKEKKKTLRVQMSLSFENDFFQTKRRRQKREMSDADLNE